MTDSLTFEPQEFHAAVGETVTFENSSGAPHTVTAYDDGIPEGGEYFASGGFDSEEAARDDVAAGLIEPDGTYEVTFDEPGTYEYFCIPHEGSGMTGEIVVEE
jgi:plastocyanin